MPVSDRPRKIAHADYATEERMQRVITEVDNILEDFFEEHLEQFPDIEGKSGAPFEVEIDSSLKMKVDKSAPAHVQQEHALRHKKIMEMAKKYFGYDVPAEQEFESDKPEHRYISFIHITVSELPGIAESSEHAFPKKMRQELAKELKAELSDEIGEDIEGIMVKTFTERGSKDIGEYYFTKQKIQSEYDHVHFIVAFKWRHRPLFQHKEVGYGASREQQRAARRSKLFLHKSEEEINEALDGVIGDIKTLEGKTMMSTKDLLNLIHDQME